MSTPEKKSSDVPKPADPPKPAATTTKPATPATSPVSPPPIPPPEPPTDPRSLADLVTDVSERGSTLVREEIELAKAEISEKVGKLVKGSVVGVAAGVFAFLALILVTKRSSTARSGPASSSRPRPSS